MLFFNFTALTQEIELTLNQLTTAGVNTATHSINISKWKIGQIHTLVLSDLEETHLKKTDWQFKTYPNPFSEIINVQFLNEKNKEIVFRITDMQGKTTFLEKKLFIRKSEIIQFNLSHLNNGIYVISAISETDGQCKILKIQKNK